MKNLIITFASQKGGVGKTSLCSLFATYCVEQGLPVAVLDADTQLSLRKNRFDDAFCGQYKPLFGLDEGNAFNKGLRA